MILAVGDDQFVPPERRWGRLTPIAVRARRFLRFGLVGMSGVLVNEVALAMFVDAFNANLLLGAVLATQFSTAWNFALVEWWAFEGAGKRTGRGRRLLMFWAVNLAALGLRGPILALLTSEFHVHYLISNIVSLGVLVVLRFAIADTLIWGKRSGSVHPVAPSEPPAALEGELVEDLGWALDPVTESDHLASAVEDLEWVINSTDETPQLLAPDWELVGTTSDAPAGSDRTGKSDAPAQKMQPSRTEVPRFGTITPPPMLP